jgi:glycosyltransferase involved in cell wall biosynthesis
LKHRIAIVTTHPIQYNAPLFALLHKRNFITIKVFYTWGDAVLETKYDPGFQKSVKWDIDLLNGYNYTFVRNIAKMPGSHHFMGINNPTLNEEITAWGASAVLVYGWSFKSHINCLRHFYNKIPVYFRGDSILEEGGNVLKRLAKSLLLKYVYSKVDKAFFVGDLNKAYFKNYGLAEKKLVYAPHTIDNARFYETRNEHNFRKELNIADDCLVFLYAGKFEAKKNVQLLASAFTKLNYSNSILVLAGNGSLEASLKEEFGSNKNIMFLPFVNQSLMPSLYNMANIFVLPSKGPGETWGLAVNEAMAVGKAVIISDKCGCVNNLVSHGNNGFKFASENEIDLVEKLNYFAQNASAATDMGQNSLSIISKMNFQNVCLSLETAIMAQ